MSKTGDYFIRVCLLLLSVTICECCRVSQWEFPTEAPGSTSDAKQKQRDEDNAATGFSTTPVTSHEVRHNVWYGVTVLLFGFIFVGDINIRCTTEGL